MSNPSRDAIEQSLSNLVREQGQWIARDPVRVRTLLQSAHAGSQTVQPRDLDAAVAAVEYGVFDQLAANPAPEQVEQFLGYLTAYGFNDDEARWVVGAWARAAGLPVPPGVAAAGGAAAAVPPAPPTMPPPVAPPAAAVPPPTPYPAPTPGPATTGYPAPAGAPAAGAAAAGVGAAAAGGAAAGGYGGPPGYGAANPPGTPPSGGSSSSNVALIVGIVILVVALLAGLVIVLVARGGDVASPPDPTLSPATTAAVTTTSEEEPPTTKRSTTTRRPTTTTEESTTTTEEVTTTTTVPPIAWAQFVDPGGRYAVDFPGTPGLEQQNTNIEGNNVGLYIYSAAARGITYELLVFDLPPGFYFSDPRAGLEGLMGPIVSNVGGSVTARDPSDFAGNPALFIATKSATKEGNFFGLIAGNRVYLLGATGADFTEADFPRFRNSFQIR